VPRGFNIKVPLSVTSTDGPYVVTKKYNENAKQNFKMIILTEKGEKISDNNFKDHNGNWFQRGYDQALMLPLLKLTQKRKYIDEICYLYNIESVSVNDRNWAEMRQLSTINLIRARGFLD